MLVDVFWAWPWAGLLELKLSSSKFGHFIYVTEPTLQASTNWFGLLDEALMRTRFLVWFFLFEVYGSNLGHCAFMWQERLEYLCSYAGVFEGYWWESMCIYCWSCTKSLGFHCWWNRPVQVNEWLFSFSWSVFIL